MSFTPDEKILILDFGSQYNQLIARRVREARVYCELMSHHATLDDIKAFNPKGIILSGGPDSVNEKGAPNVRPEVLELGIPILGICYGMQTMVRCLGGQVGPAVKREYGRTEIKVEDHSTIFQDLSTKLICWMSHGDHVLKIPRGFNTIASSFNCEFAAIHWPEKRFFGVQFHPEVTHTPWGLDLLKNFLYDICGCSRSWTVLNFLENIIGEIQDTVKKDRVLCGLSGGVDSSTVAAVLHRAIGKQLTCVYVDHGFMRLKETEQVQETFEKHFRMNLITVDASERFLKQLVRVKDPEKKRKLIGGEFIKVFEEEAVKVKNLKYLAQGTLYPDVVESGASSTGTKKPIKTHHNVGGLPEKMNLKLIEPLRLLFKDEVREVARSLGMPPAMVNRQPFPGPGLAIRVIGAVTKDKLEILKQADAIFLEEMDKWGWASKSQQFFAVLPDVKTVGVMGDMRTYEYPIVLRAVTTDDFMTSDWARLPYELLEKLSNRILNEVKGVNRLVYDISSKPPATIEWE